GGDEGAGGGDRGEQDERGKRGEQSTASRPLHDGKGEEIVERAAGEHATVARAAVEDASPASGLRALHARGIARARKVHVFALALLVIVEARDVGTHAVHRRELKRGRGRGQP